MNMWKYISMATLAMMMVACSNEENATVENGRQGKVMTLTTTLKMADNASTRTLTDEETQITAEWEEGDQFTINYQTTADDGTENKSGNGVAEVISVSDGTGTATVQATLEDALDGGAIDFSYPHAHNDPGTDPNTEQVGTLDDINANFACMYGSGTMSVSGTTVSIDDGGVAMTQEICIWKFTFTDGTSDITSAITNLKLAFQYVTYDVNPTSQSAIYVAIYDEFPYTTGGVTITATTATGVYIASKPSVTLQVGQMYESNVALSPAGLFTINAGGDKVIFSPGNLQATYDGSEWSWAFAEHQYDFIGVNTANNKINGNGTVSNNGTVDLFGRSTGSTYYGINNSTSTNYYTGSFSDWGNNVIGNYAANTWRTPTSTEWTYLFNTRVTTSGERDVLARVNDINGVILFPDDWDTSYYFLTNYNDADVNYFSNNITSADWANKFEAHGAVFLPAAGYRSGNSVSYGDAGQEGFYMSSSISGTYTYCVRFMERTASIGPEPGGMSSGALNPADELGCWCGGSVRLVRDAN